MAMKNKWNMTLATVALSGWLGLNAAQAQTAPSPAPVPGAPAAPVAPVPVEVDANGPMTANGGHAASNWYLQAEFLYLRRDAPRRTMSVDAADGTLVSTKLLHFDFEPGFRLGVGYQCSPTWAVEASFFTTADWSNHQGHSAELTPAGGGFAGTLFSGFSQFGNNLLGTQGVFPFDGAVANFLSYSAELENLEVNVRHQLVTHNDFVLNTLFGVRNVHTHEKFDFAAVGTTDGLSGSPSATGDYATEANSDIFAFQVGGDLSYWFNDSLSLGGVAKAGYGWNRSRERSAINGAFIGTLGGGPSVPFSEVGVSEHVGGAGVLELGIFANWRCTSGIVVRAGYQAMFVTNVALAPRQIDFKLAPNSLLNTDHDGTIFLHGPSLGIEMNW
jgi:hypothetical protein